MKSSVLATIAISIGIIAMLYSACNKSNETVPGSKNTLEVAKTELLKMETEYKAMIGVHRQWVNEHAELFGNGNDEAHLSLEQEHMVALEKYKELVAKHKLFLQTSDAGDDNGAMQDMIHTIQSETADVKAVMSKIKADHESMLSAHQ